MKKRRLGVTFPVERFKFPRLGGMVTFPKQLVSGPGERDGAKPALKIPLFQVVFLANLEIRQRIQVRRATAILLGKPDLVAPQHR